MNIIHILSITAFITTTQLNSFSWDSVSAWFSSPKNNAVFTKEYDFSPRGTIKIINDYGDIRITTWSKNKIMLQATMRGTPEEIEQVTINPDHTTAALTVSATIPENSTIHIDYVLIVPEHAELVINSREKGSMKIKNSKNRIYATTHSGNIKLHRTHGNIHVQLDKGSLYAKFEQFEKNDSLFCEIHTKGNAVIKVPPTIHADAQLTTRHGTITSDILLTLKPVTTLLNKETWQQLQQMVQATFGNGGAPLTIQVQNGNISIAKL